MQQNIRLGPELLSVVRSKAPQTLSTLEPYRFCPLVGYFVSYLTKYLNESCEAPGIRFSPASRFLRKAQEHRFGFDQFFLKDTNYLTCQVLVPCG